MTIFGCLLVVIFIMTAEDGTPNSFRVIMAEQSWREAPAIFRLIPLRNGAKYRALQRYCFNIVEKMWVCNHIVSLCDDIESNIARDVVLFSTRYHLNPSIITSWLNRYADGVSFNARICPLDNIGINILRGMVATGAHIGESHINYQNRLYDCILLKRNRSYFRRGYL